MEFEFDKEMDSLLRQSARGETVFANPEPNTQNTESFHLDADEISLFAENALSEKTKTLYAAHFADCGRCRAILANVISLESETVAEVEASTQKTVISSIVPWYKLLFATPNLAYAMGALVLAFAGLIGYTALQSSNGSRNAEVAQVESTPRMNGRNAGEMSAATESNQTAMSNGGATASNSATANAAMSSGAASNGASAVSNTTTTASAPPAVLPNAGAMSNAASAATPPPISTQQLDDKVETAKNQVPKPTAPAPARQSDNFNSIANGATFAEEQKARLRDDERLRATDADQAMQTPAQRPAPPAAARSAPAELPAVGRTASDSNNARARRKTSTETRQVGGKTFRRADGAWFDADYKGQSTTNVARNSSDFKKLDAGLRAVAESLSGAVVVVYNGRAYRIQ